MARVCEICDKGTLAAKRKKHNVRTSQWRFRATSKPRKLAPNLRKVRVEVDGKEQTVKVCMKCYKRLRADI